MNVTLQRLRYFAAVAEELSFTRAAARLHVSQPSLSAQIRVLERELGVELLARTTRRVELTGAGRAFADDLRRLLDGLEDAAARARRIAEREAGTLRAAYTASVGYQALPLILDELEATVPDLSVIAHRAWSTRVVDQVRSGEADLGLVREFSESWGLASETIRLEPLAMFASVRHPLAGRDAVRMDDLRDETFIVVDRALAPGFHDLVMGLCRRAGYTPRVMRLSAPDNREPLLASLSRHADRIFVGPESTSTTSWDGVVHVRVEDPDARMRLSLVHRHGADTPGIAAFVAAARAVARREGWLGHPAAPART